MITSGSYPYRVESCNVNPRLSKSIRNAYLEASQYGDWTLWENKKVLRKYYPRKIVTAVNPAQRLPDWFTASTKHLKSLKIKYFSNIKSVAHSVRSLEVCKSYAGPKQSPFEFRKTMLASKKLETFCIREKCTLKMLKEMRYLRALRSLNLSISNKQLPCLTTLVESLNNLESLSLLFSVTTDFQCFDPNYFLNFCKRSLTKSQLKAFNIQFNFSSCEYSTDTFEKVFQLLEQSKIEKWNIQANLAEDQVIEIAKKYRIFKEAEHIAVHAQNLKVCPGGMTSTYLSSTNIFKERRTKLLDIYLQKSQRKKRNHMFDLESFLNQCPNVEYLFFEWEKNLMKHPLSITHQQYQSMKAIFFQIPFTKGGLNWRHLLQILDNTPFLEKFRLEITQDYAKPITPDVEADAIRECVKRLVEKKKTLRSVGFQILGLSQEILDAFHCMFEALENLNELNLTFHNSNNPIIPKFPINKFAEMRELRLRLPFAATNNYLDLESVGKMISDLPNLRVVQLTNAGKEVSWATVQALMKKLRRITGLREFRFTSDIVFDGEYGKDPTGITKQEIENLVYHCRMLEVAEIFYNRLYIEYNRSPVLWD